MASKIVKTRDSPDFNFTKPIIVRQTHFFRQTIMFVCSLLMCKFFLNTKWPFAAQKLFDLKNTWLFLKVVA